jgi:hypothetical protein
MDVFEVIAFIILLAGFVIYIGLVYVLPVYIAYRKGKNWKKYILPTVLFGPFVIPFALYQGKDAKSVNTAGADQLNSSYSATSDVSALEPGEVVTLKLSAKKAGNKGVLTFTDKKIVFDGGIGSKHSFVIPMRNLKDITFFLNTIQFSAIEVKGATLTVTKSDIDELKAFVAELDHPQINPIKMEKYPKPSTPVSAEVVEDPVQHVEQPAAEPVIDSAATDEPVEVEIEQPKADEVLKPEEPSTSITEEQAAGVVPPPPPIFKA